MNFDTYQSNENTCMISCEISLTIRRANLSRQRDQFEAYVVANRYIIEKIYENIASGINFNQKGLLCLLKHCQTHAIKAEIIEFKNRLARFGVRNSIDKFGQTWIACPSPSIEEMGTILVRKIIFTLRG
ncbi:MAG: hypothetical protein ACFFD2_16800 [Promethearchaeota archaeon]